MDKVPAVLPVFMLGVLHHTLAFKAYLYVGEAVGVPGALIARVLFALIPVEAPIISRRCRRTGEKPIPLRDIYLGAEDYHRRRYRHGRWRA